MQIADSLFHQCDYLWAGLLPTGVCTCIVQDCKRAGWLSTALRQGLSAFLSTKLPYVPLYTRQGLMQLYVELNRLASTWPHDAHPPQGCQPSFGSSKRLGCIFGRLKADRLSKHNKRLSAILRSEHLCIGQKKACTDQLAEFELIQH